MPQNERKVIYGMVCSLDGYIAGPDGKFEWAEPDQEVHQHFNDWEKDDIDTHLYGRVMYEMMESFWPTAWENPDAAAVEVEYSHIWNAAKKVVFSTTLEEVGEKATLVKGNLAEAIADLKAQPGKNMALGGAGLAASLNKLGLIDEFHVYLAPVVVGGGLPMFKEVVSPTKLQRIETHTFSGGTVLIKYQVIR